VWALAMQKQAERERLVAAGLVIRVVSCVVAERSMV
jgi:hypothetical protein